MVFNSFGMIPTLCNVQRLLGWVLPVYQHEGLEQLLTTLPEKVIAPSEGKVKALQGWRRIIEAEKTKPHPNPCPLLALSKHLSMIKREKLASQFDVRYRR